MKIIVTIPEEAFKKGYRRNRKAANYLRKIANQVEEGWSHGAATPQGQDLELVLAEWERED